MAIILLIKLSDWQPYHPAAQDWLPTEAKQSRIESCQYLDRRPPGKTGRGVREASRGCSPCGLCGS